MPLRLRSIDRRFALFCRSGDAAALGQVFDATATELLRIAAWLCGNRADAEDLLQRTFLTAIEDRARFASERRALPWLCGILTNQARNLRRERARRAALPAPPEPVADPVARAADAEFAAWLADTQRAIGTPYAEVLQLHLAQGMNAAEIAAQLGRPAGTVRTQLMRALERLRRRLPASLAAVAVPTVVDPAVLAAVRAEVVAAARRLPVPAAGAAVGGILFAGGLLMSKAVLVTATAALALALLFARPWETASSASPALADGDVAPSHAASAALAASAAADGAAGEAAVRAPAAVTDPAVEPGFGELRVAVHWQHDGAPAGGVGVTARPESRELENGSRRDDVTGQDGTCTLRHLAPGRWIVECSHAARGVAVAVADGARGQAELAAVHAATVRGTVVDDGQLPVAGASIWIADGHGPDDRQFAIASSDARGWFEVPIADLHFLGARKQGQVQSLFVPVRAADGDRTITLRLRGAGAMVRGRVVDPDGAPVAWARVEVGPSDQLVGVGGPLSDLVEAYGRQVVTGRDGTFAFDDVAARQLGVWAWAAGFAPSCVLVTPAVGTETAVEVRFEAEAIVAGHVHDANGRAVAGALIVLDTSRSPLWRSGGAWTHSDDDGAFELGSLPAGPARLHVMHVERDGGAAAHTELQLSAGQRAAWDPVLTLGRTIRGVVWGPDGAPIVGVTVGALRELDGLPLRHCRTDARGAFVITDVGDEPVLVEVGEPDREPLAAVDSVAPGTDGLEIRVTHADLRTVHVRGRLVDENGGPVAGEVGVPSMRGVGRVRSAKTGPDGSFDLGPLRPGARTLEITTQRGPVLRPPVDVLPDQVLDLGAIRVPRPGSVALHLVRADGSKVAEGLVYLREPGRDGRWVATATIANGSGRADVVPPGHWVALANDFLPAEIEVRSDETTQVAMRPR